MIISRTPLRVSFVGGGTDLPSFSNKERGAVVSTAIKKYVYVVVHNSFNKKNIISYSKREVVDSVDEIQNTRIREAMKMTGVTKGVEIHSLAEVPVGTGLGGSSSFTVGLLNALYAHQGKHISAERLAKEAAEIEINILKEPIGKQDQYAAAYGGINKIEFNNGDVKLRPITCKKETKSDLQNNLLLFYIGGEREASSILSSQSKNIEEKEGIFEMHKKMRDFADKMEDYLSNNDLTRFGELLHENWILKQNLANGISNDRINTYYKKALDAGAIGGKLLGAGGTGFILLFVNPEKQNDVRKALEDVEEYSLEFDKEGSKIIYVGD